MYMYMFRKNKMAGRMHSGMITKKVEKLLSGKHVNANEETRYKKLLHKHSLDDDSTPYWPCVDVYLSDYLNQPVVQRALHVKQSDDGEPVEWQECNNDVFHDWPDEDWLTGMQQTYQSLVDDYDISILIYSGDDDSVCSTQGTQFWLNKMGWSTLVEWQVWEDDTTQVGGYYTSYVQLPTLPKLKLPIELPITLTTEQPAKSKVTVHYYTVRSSGHMVPTTTPARALNILHFYLDLPGVSTL
ncbi:hypothetical protein RFI_16150 [Reticulomyxa filosa]|uniref:Serine carboxypeptidase n=1 Tax=Reticulomyxa filosa TaxID=46433 RepID=X6N4U9_RETFI|nr:hypothetical protein RFI_16150 [Reticulomyxa filosa]|eukprot:ETO21056.1 hypothetical protein RFI_16150 [Reticulomyxa filosa]